MKSYKVQKEDIQNEQHRSPDGHYYLLLPAGLCIELGTKLKTVMYSYESFNFPKA